MNTPRIQGPFSAAEYANHHKIHVVDAYGKLRVLLDEKIIFCPARTWPRTYEYRQSAIEERPPQ
jgi:hypothetical protein